jgi:hypothetical protein
MLTHNTLIPLFIFPFPFPFLGLKPATGLVDISRMADHYVSQTTTLLFILFPFPTFLLFLSGGQDKKTV